MRRLLITLPLVAILALPPVASASDQSIWNAWNHTKAGAINKAVKRENKAIKRMLKAKYKNRALIRKAIKTFPPVRRLLGKVVTAVKRQSPSSQDGATAKKRILTSLRSWQTAVTLNGKALKAVLAGHRSKALRIFDRQQAAYDRSSDNAKQAIALLKGAGVDVSKKRAVR